MRAVKILGVVFVFLLTLSLPAPAGELPRYTLGGEMVHGGSAEPAKAGGDTINLMAAHDDPTNGPGEPYYFGDFEDADGNPAWNGWTHYDVTQPTETHWNVSTYNQPDPNNHAAWCGSNIVSCGPDDPEGGYGNAWHDLLEFRRTVPFPDLNTTVTVTATLIHDSEPTYDYTHLSYRYQAQRIADLRSWDGMGTVAVEDSVTFLPEEYLDGTDIAVYFRFTSDGAWSDEDCLYPSQGGCQVDDINVRLVNGDYTEDFFENFEHGGDPEDFGLWNIAYPPGVGDFAQIWVGLRDIDPCVNNYSPQVAFIDDGQVVPGTGGSRCINWCYGPGGYIVNTTGGLAGPDKHIYNVAESPVMDWPEPPGGTGPDYDGIRVALSVYRHEDLSADAPGIFYNWGIRSADTDGSAGNGVQDIEEMGWRRREFVYYGGPDYHRLDYLVMDLVNPGRDEIQVRVLVYEVGYAWYWTGNDGYPAPYFDNVTVKVFPLTGPSLSARELDLAQDNFPGSGPIDYEDLGSLSVRFDMANNISLPAHLRNDPGDSIVVDAWPVREGSDLAGPIKLHYLLDRNPVFTPEMRTAGLPDQGIVEAMPAVSYGHVILGKWAFDFPDTGFLFPGDVLHYFIEATEAIGGPGGSDPQTALMPPDTTGFSTGFGDPLGYNSTFTVRALPSIREEGPGYYEHPAILFINDFGNRGGENEWYIALHHNGLLIGEGYDAYYVNAPTSGVGNGIGGRASAATLSGYSDILYTCGDLGINTIANGDYQNDPGDDVGALANWLDLGGRDIFLTGNNLASDLAQAGTATLAFLEDRMGITVVTDDIRATIGNQTTPLVVPIVGNPVFLPTSSLTDWYAYGSCRIYSHFDGVDTFGTGQRIAEFVDPLGVGYSYSACTLNIMNPGPGQSRVISMPVDLMYVLTNPDAPGHPWPARAQLLRDVLEYFGCAGSIGLPSGLGDLPAFAFTTSNYPNPFNPVTTIKYSLPKAGHLKLSIYNVRGQLVKTLIDGPRPAGADQRISWDGTDSRGSAAASGIYFYEARALGDVRIGKMTLMK